MIDRYFKLAENHTSVKHEMLGGLTNALIWILTVLFILRYVYLAAA